MIKLSSAKNVTVRSDRAVILVSANPRRKVLNVTAGDFDVWVGQVDVRPDTEQNKIPAGTRGVFKDIQSEIWVIAGGENIGKISFSEEVEV
ncbi:hypothetical protein [Kordiimonas gwangyangensis]|uniref:hypothetical protein n=1 Tax=Kordiimonas gwangyangensis TaxID=288022 RepID=UPI000370C756|nr:hypothetical protein [Kordiimonas gwangyangensis]